MKTTSNTLHKIVSGGITVGLLIPSFLVAQSSTHSPTVSPAASPKAEKQAFCARLPQYKAKATQRYEDQMSKFMAKRNDRLAILAKHRGESGQKLAVVRMNWDAHSNEYFAKLMARATTDAQKQAVTTFKTSAESAIKTRRAAVDQAMATFRTNMDQALAAKKSAIDTALSVFKASVDAAFAKAQTDCAAGANPQAVRETLKADLKAARMKLESNRKSVEQLKGTAESLAKARKQAIDKAFADYRTTLQTAVKNLKAALSGGSGKKVSSTPVPSASATPTPSAEPTATLTPSPTAL